MQEKGCAISGLRDERLSRIVAALQLAKKAGDSGNRYDWAKLYNPDGGATHPQKPFVGPLALQRLPGRGLGLVATQAIEAGSLLLLEEALALVPAKTSQDAELTEACASKLQLLGPGSLLRAATSRLCTSASQDELPEGTANSREETLRSYLECLRAGDDPSAASSNRAPAEDLRLTELLRANARKTEHWDPWTLLLDEGKAHAGLWPAASLFNHSCWGNVAISYGWLTRPSGRKEAAPWLLIARASRAVEAGEELCHTYVYPFEPVLERQARLSSSYHFRCACSRCLLEAPLAKKACGMADELEQAVAAFGEARKAPRAGAMAAVLRELRGAVSGTERLAAEAAAKQELLPKARAAMLWRAQFVWGVHGLAMAAEFAGRFEEAASAFRKCVELISLLEPGGGYEVKYRMMLVQCLSRQALSGCGAPGQTAAIREVLREAEEGHNRCYGGGGQHFVARTARRLEEVHAAMRRSQ